MHTKPKLEPEDELVGDGHIRQLSEISFSAKASHYLHTVFLKICFLLGTGETKYYKSNKAAFVQ
jgi:hypothetical protein